jgi:hypothetical protein
MKDDKKVPEVVFAPGCFDNFEGTQEELDKLIAEIKGLAESGELFDKASPVDVDELDDEDLVLLAEALGVDLDELEEEGFFEETPTNKKYLQ